MKKKLIEVALSLEAINREPAQANAMAGMVTGGIYRLRQLPALGRNQHDSCSDIASSFTGPC